MDINLLHHTPLWVASKAIRKCWASEDKSDTYVCLSGCVGCNAMVVGVCTESVESTCRNYTGHKTRVTGEKDKELIDRVGNKNKHKSTLEHLVYTFDIDGISRACLQEIARHRMASYSVKSTRYTLKELKEAPTIYDGYPEDAGCLDFYDMETASKFVVLTGNERVDGGIVHTLHWLQHSLLHGTSNDIAKYCLPEAYKTSLVMTINARSLQNFLSLRTDKSALWEIQNLARAMYDVLPEEHKYLFQEFIKKDNKCHTK